MKHTSIPFWKYWKIGLEFPQFGQESVLLLEKIVFIFIFFNSKSLSEICDELSIIEKLPLYLNPVKWQEISKYYLVNMNFTDFL